jgi:putative flippase GtrA
LDSFIHEYLLNKKATFQGTQRESLHEIVEGY